MYMGDLYLRQSSGCEVGWSESCTDFIRQPFAKGKWDCLYRFYIFHLFRYAIRPKSIALISKLCTGDIPLVEHFCTLK